MVGVSSSESPMWRSLMKRIPITGLQTSSKVFRLQDIRAGNLKIRQRRGDGFFDGVGAVAVEAGVYFFQAADEVEDLVSRVGAAGGCAEMRAATEGA